MIVHMGAFRRKHGNRDYDALAVIGSSDPGHPVHVRIAIEAVSPRAAARHFVQFTLAPDIPPGSGRPGAPGTGPIERNAMTHASDTDYVDVSGLSRDELIAHNLRVVEAHFHNENPGDVDKAIALYGPGVVWEAPVRGQIYTDPAQVKENYLAVFRTVHFNRTTVLRQFATERFVFHDQIADLTVVGEEMPNLGFKPGDRVSMRLVHCFELDKGKIIREIAYEISREYHGPADHDAIPDGAIVTDYPDGPHYGHW